MALPSPTRSGFVIVGVPCTMQSATAPLRDSTELVRSCTAMSTPRSHARTRAIHPAMEPDEVGDPERRGQPAQHQALSRMERAYEVQVARHIPWLSQA